MNTPLRFKIVDVDMNGYLGREHHPHPSDVGEVVTPIKMEAWWTRADATQERLMDHRERAFCEPDRDLEITDAEVPAILRELTDPINGDDGVLWMWTCVTADGRVLDLLDFEVEPVPEADPVKVKLLEAARHAAGEWRLHGSLTDSCRVLERAIAAAEGR